MPGASPDRLADRMSAEQSVPEPNESGRLPGLPAGRSHSQQTDFASRPLAARDAAILVLQLALCAIVVWQFELEARRHLLLGLLIASGGFLVNSILSPGWRRPWFAVVSTAGVLAVLGWQDGLAALGIAVSLIAAVRLPLAYWTRVAVVVGLAALFTWFRSQSIALFWPVVGSMFMFRMISYLHSMRRERGPRTLAETAGYFLMLPNPFFTLFPVVDAQVFRETWYNDERRVIYQKGVHWIATGLLHLLLYRVIKYEVLPSPLSVGSLREAMLYLAANYALYLQVSGSFHVVCGMVHLFGWNLPRTHDHYFLASSFSDIWRRINIYWKDFLTKTLFYPAYFTLRTRPAFSGRSGDGAAIAIAVLWVFFWTWLAHSWQTYWIGGRFPLAAGEAAMWLAVGGLVAMNAVLDYRSALRRRARTNAQSWRQAALWAVKVMAMFGIVSLFWARWTNVETFRYVLYVVKSRGVTAADAIVLCVWGAGVFSALTLWAVWSRRPAGKAPRLDRRVTLDRQAGINIAVLATVVVLAAPHGLLGPSSGRIGQWIERLKTDRLAPGEAMAVVDGYYEQLAHPTSQGATLLGTEERRPQAQGDLFSSMLRPRTDLLGFELIPGWRGVFSGNELTINRWGMRDMDRSLKKPAGVVRIAVVGSSVVMGYGVKDDETMTQRLEQMLNARGDGVRYEVLNFGSGRYYAIHRRLLLEKKILAFEPDAVVYVAHQDELRAAGALSSIVIDGQDLDDDCLKSCVENAGLSPGDSKGAITQKMNRETLTILRCTYDRLVRTCRENKLRLEFVYLPIPGKFEYPIDPKIVIEIAGDAGMPTHDFSDVWGTGSPAALVVPDTQHPTASGQQVVAERLSQLLRRSLESLKVRSPAS